MIELSRTVTFGQYINNGSVLVRLDPRVKLLSTLLLIALISYIGSFTAFALCLLCCILLQWASRISVAYILRSFKLLIFAVIIIYIFEVLFYSSSSQQRTLIWQWWIFAVSWEGIIRSMLTVLRVLLLYYISSMLMFTTSLLDLTNGAEGLLLPLQKIGIPVSAFIMVLVIAMKFVPIFVAEVERLTKAQAARGVRFDQGNFIRRAIKLAPLLIPLFLNGFQRADALATAMEARCYRPGRSGLQRSKRRELRFQRSDVFALIFVVVFCVGAIVLNFVAAF